MRDYEIESLYASSELSNSQGHYPADNLINHGWEPWAEGVQGSGIGESFTFKLSGKGVISGFALKNGHGDLNYFSQNNRVKSFKIYIRLVREPGWFPHKSCIFRTKVLQKCDLYMEVVQKLKFPNNSIEEEYTETIPIKDSISFEQYTFTESAVCKTIRFEIDDVYPGANNDTFIAEIALFRLMASDSEFYENVLFWLGNYAVDSKYENNIQGIASISDTDKILLRDYLPFDSLVDNNYFAKKSKIALLGNPSSLRLHDNLPRIDGATAMYPLYSSFVRAVYPRIEINIDENGEWEFEEALFKWPYLPNRSAMPVFSRYGTPTSFNEKFDKKLESIVQCNTTSEAYRRLIEGETDIVFCYEPSQAERNAAAEKEKSFNLTPIAKDAFVFIVNEKNVLNNITQRRIRDIYSGRVTNWKPINGIDEPVIAYQRRENSGSQTILQSIMKEDRLMPPILDGEFVLGGMSAMICKVASDYYNYNSAIGYTFLFYLTQMAGGGGVKPLAVDSIAPTRHTIQNNTYPFVQTVYAVTTGNESENTKKFIEWILSAQGQELAVKTGYTPIR